jgi:hypothetical protein
MEERLRLRGRRACFAARLIITLLTFFLTIMLLQASSAGASRKSTAAPPTPSLGGSGGGSRNPGGPGPLLTVAYVYTGTINVAGVPNQITGFSVTSDGVAHVLPGSPYSGPSSFPVVSSGFVFANDLTNIETYRRNSDGSLTPISSISGVAHNQIVHDSGVGAMVLDHTGSSLYVVEINFDGTNNDAYATFSVGRNGRLSFVANGPSGVNFNGPLTFSQDNRFAYGQGCYFLGWDLFGYERLSNGALQLIAAHGNPPPSMETLCPGPSAASAKNVLAVAVGNPGINTNTQLATYLINSNGTLTLSSNSLLVTPFSSVSSVAFDPTGTYLAVGGYFGVQIYKLGAGADLIPVGTPAVSSSIINDLKWDKTNHVYALSGKSLHILNFSQGALSEAAGSPYSVAQQGVLAVLPTR